MKRVLLLFSVMLLAALTVLSANELGDLATIKQGLKTKRISSYDRSGGNNDRFENIPRDVALRLGYRHMQAESKQFVMRIYE